MIVGQNLMGTRQTRGHEESPSPLTPVLSRETSFEPVLDGVRRLRVLWDLTIAKRSSIIVLCHPNM